MNALVPVAALLVTIGVMVVALRFVAKLQRGGIVGAARHLEIIDRVSAGPRQGVILLRVGVRVLVVGVGEQCTLLGELNEAERLDALRAPAPRGTHGVGAWRRAIGLGALLLAMGGGARRAGAQVITSPKPAPTAGVSRGHAAVPTPTVQAPTPPNVDVTVGTPGNQLKLSGAVGVVIFMGALTLLPAVMLLMTGFTRILIVLSFLRSALGTQTAPPTPLLVAIAVLLTGVVMNPVLTAVNRDALQPYLNGTIGQTDAYKAGVAPLRKFMLANIRDRDLAVFTRLTHADSVKTIDDVPTMTIVAAFVTGELRVAFQMGFIIYVPFLVIDLIVASVLMSMGMFMLPPVMVSLPFKLLLFVLADGWMLVVQNLVTSFRIPA